MHEVERATPEEMPAVRALVATAELTVEGLGDVPTVVFIVRNGTVILGAAALESHGTDGLLRSVVVADAVRGEGIGSLLVAAAEDHAQESGIAGLYLLTETAREFFSARGYEEIGRGDGPRAVMESVEWSEACSLSAVAMVLQR